MERLEEFIQILDREDRGEALRFILDLLERQEMSFLEVYEKLLTPALNMMVPSGNETMDIWHEHIRTSIIKTIVENCYSYVIQARDALGHHIDKTAIILTPPEEYHSLGARMVKDVFTYLGYDAIFVGGNTPLRVLEAGMKSRPIDYVVISVSNPYHLVSTRNMIEAIRKTDSSVVIIVGGNAVSRLGVDASQLKADHVLQSLADLERLETEVTA